MGSNERTPAGSPTAPSPEPPGARHLRLDALLHRHRHPARNLNELEAERMTLGQRVADAVGAALGSWRFIIAQSVLLAAWVVLNVAAWLRHWGSILLTLALSFQTAYAAPITMMSQNRQSARNRLAAVDGDAAAGILDRHHRAASDVVAPAAEGDAPLAAVGDRRPLVRHLPQLGEQGSRRREEKVVRYPSRSSRLPAVRGRFRAWPWRENRARSITARATTAARAPPPDDRPGERAEGAGGSDRRGVEEPGGGAGARHPTGVAGAEDEAEGAG